MVNIQHNDLDQIFGTGTILTASRRQSWGYAGLKFLED